MPGKMQAAIGATAVLRCRGTVDRPRCRECVPKNAQCGLCGKCCVPPCSLNVHHQRGEGSHGYRGQPGKRSKQMNSNIFFTSLNKAGELMKQNPCLVVACARHGKGPRDLARIIVQLLYACVRGEPEPEDAVILYSVVSVSDLDDLKKQFSKLSFQELGEQASSSSPARAIGEMQKQVEHVDRLSLERLVEKMDSFLPETPRSSELINRSSRRAVHAFVRWFVSRRAARTHGRDAGVR